CATLLRCGRGGVSWKKRWHGFSFALPAVRERAELFRLESTAEAEALEQPRERWPLVSGYLEETAFLQVEKQTRHRQRGRPNYRCSGRAALPSAWQICLFVWPPIQPKVSLQPALSGERKCGPPSTGAE